MTQAGWEPIETAPKDGTKILAFDPDEGEPMICMWLAGRLSWSNWIVNLGTDFMMAIRPTHWMPLPLPPEPPRQIEEAQRADTATAES